MQRVVVGAARGGEAPGVRCIVSVVGKVCKTERENNPSYKTNVTGKCIGLVVAKHRRRRGCEGAVPNECWEQSLKHRKV